MKQKLIYHDTSPSQLPNRVERLEKDNKFYARKIENHDLRLDKLESPPDKEEMRDKISDILLSMSYGKESIKNSINLILDLIYKGK